MFESLEDMIEQAINLNYKSYPFLESLYDALLAEEDQSIQVNKVELEALLRELFSFLDTIENAKDNEGNINIYEFDERKIH